MSISDFGSHFFDGPSDYSPYDEGAYMAQHDGYLENVSAGAIAGSTPVILRVPGQKTAYYYLHAKWSRVVTPGTTVSDGYDMAAMLEEVLKQNLEEWLGSDMQTEVFVQVDVR